MADEPRRSGRATKGLHTKNDGSPESTNDAPKSKPTATKNKGSTKASAEPVQDEEEEDDSVIRCVCGNQTDKPLGRMMICCDMCESWQHNDCMGITENEDELPENYLCERCAPDQHKDLLAAMNRGEKPWERKKKPTKKGKAVRQSSTMETSEQGTPAADSSNKRKHGNDDAEQLQPSKLRKPSEDPPTKRKSDAGSKAGRKVSKIISDSSNPAESIGNLQENRKRVAQAFKDTFVKSIKDLSSKGLYRIPDGHTADSLGEQKSLLLEHAMFVNLCGDPPDYSGLYKLQFASIRSNVNKNHDLFLRFLDDSVNPTTLATMSSADMASEEQRQKDLAMKEENDKQSMLTYEEAPRIRRTHKGEELIDPDNSQFMSESFNVPKPKDLVTDEPLSAQSPTGATPFSPTTAQSPVAASPAIDTSFHNPRRSSSNFNYQDVLSKVKSPDIDQPRTMQSHMNAPTTKTQHDPDIDRLLEDGDEMNYDQMDSTAESRTVWKGRVKMPCNPKPIADFEATARHVAGSDLVGRISLSEIFSTDLVIHGRIPSVSADAYITSLASARSTDVTVMSLIAIPGDQVAAEQFDAIFDYLVPRNRFGVVGEHLHRDNVRDCYIIPLEAGMGEMPDFLDRLDYNVIEQPRPNRLLLVAFVLRWTTPPSGPSQAIATPGGTHVPMRAPQAGPAMSPSDTLQPTQPPPPSPFSHQIPQNPYDSSAQQKNPGQELAKSILGEMYHSPVAQQILIHHKWEIPPELLHNMKAIMDSHPAAQMELGVFQNVLNGGT